MMVQDILDHFLSRAEWVDRAKTVDRVIAGNANQDVDRCLVTWISSMRALRESARRGVPLVITHEPTFWNHRDERPALDAAVREKARFIEENGLSVVRLHDTWDRWPGDGIPWAWARFLELGTAPVAVGRAGYQHRYDIPPMALSELAGRVARRCASLGEPAVQVTGDPKQKVSRVGIGTGCCCDIAAFIGMGCDCSVVCDDGSTYWSVIQRCEDLGHPVIRVNHGTSEDPGMASLAAYINRALGGLRAEHLPHGSTFRLMGTVQASG